MKIETKFNIDQEVFFFEDNKVKSEKIWVIEIAIGNKTRITYSFFKANERHIIKEENEIFATKEELIASL